MNPMRLDTREPTRIAFGMGSGGGTGIDVLPAGELDSTAQLATAEVGALATHVRLAGRTSAGDGGGALYKRVVSDPGHAGAVQSADGSWWEIVPENDTLNVKQFGALDNGTAAQTAIQAAEDTAAALAAGGKRIKLAINGTFSTTQAIQKKANVEWVGPGLIQRQNHETAMGSAFALVTADGVDGWTISGVGFRNVSYARELTGDISANAGLGTRNTCIDISGCSDFTIEGCFLTHFSQGILHAGCNRFRIIKNNMDSQSGQTIDDMIAGAYTPAASGSNTRGIGSLTQGGGIPATESTNFIISDNIVEIPGLDTAIEAQGQAYAAQPNIISRNIIRGPNAGIIAYRGSQDEPDVADTYRTDTIVTDNTIQYTWEQGIYFRGVLGGTISDNQLYRTGMGGDNGSANSACGILTRVDPQVSPSKFISLANGDVSHDHPILITGNRVTDHGTAAGNDDDVIRIDVENTICMNNIITRSAEFSTMATGRAINIGVGVGGAGVRCDNNEIMGAFTTGIRCVRNPVAPRTLADTGSISGNRLRGMFETGIDTNWLGFNLRVNRNDLLGMFTMSGIALRFAVFSIVSHNMIRNTDFDALASGIMLRQGCLASNQAFLMTGGVATRNNRRGGTVTCIGNDVCGFGDPYAHDEGNAGSENTDTEFDGRCKVFRDNYADGHLKVWDFPGGIAAQNSTRIWQKHTIAFNSDVTIGQATGQVCTSPGQYGSTATTTGDTIQDSPVITNVADMDGWGIGLFVAAPGFTGPRAIVAIDPYLNTITVDQPASATAAAVVLSSPQPVWASLPILS